MALGTKTAFSKTAIRIGTEAGDGTVTSISAVIEGTSKAAGLLGKHMAADFFGNGGTVPSQGSAYFLKGSRVIKHEFDGNAFS